MNISPEAQSILQKLETHCNDINYAWNKIKNIMEKKTYYPLRVGAFGSTIVSDTDPGRYRSPDEKEKEYYGGYLIAESVPTKELAQQLVDAYNEKYEPSVITNRDALDWLDNVRKEQQNSAHSFTEGSDGENKPSLDDQIEWIEMNLRTKELGHAQDFFIAIKNNLQSVKQYQQVDVVKVIEDLMEPARNYIGERSSEEEASNDPAIQNAEVALGMLQAFKQERDEWTPEKGLKQVDDYIRKSPIGRGPSARSRGELVYKLSKMLDNTSALGEANAIIFAIEEMLKLHNVPTTVFTKP